MPTEGVPHRHTRRAQEHDPPAAVHGDETDTSEKQRQGPEVDGKEVGLVLAEELPCPEGFPGWRSRTEEIRVHGLQECERMETVSEKRGRRGTAAPHRLRDQFRRHKDGNRRQAQSQDQAAGRYPPPAAPARLTQRQDHERSEGQSLQEDVEVQTGEGQSPEGVGRSGYEGPSGRRSQTAGQGVHGEGGEGEVDGEQPGLRRRPRPESVEEVQRIEVGKGEGALVQVGVPRRPPAGGQLAGGEQAKGIERDREVPEVIGEIRYRGPGIGQQRNRHQQPGKPTGEPPGARSGASPFRPGLAQESRLSASAPPLVEPNPHSRPPPRAAEPDLMWYPFTRAARANLAPPRALGRSRDGFIVPST